VVDKVLIANITAQKLKYGVRGYRSVRASITNLVAADSVRGLKTMLVDISNPLEMERYNARAVSDPRSEIQNKDAIDRIYAALKPQYLVLLDGPDVIPHIHLNNPIPSDKDRGIPSDLPYASDERLSTRDAAKYAAVTRVVGRIPGVTGTNDPTYLAAQIKFAAAFKSRNKEDYLSHFAISTYLWRDSTALSVDNVFRTTEVKTSPPTDSRSIRRSLGRLTHFINCHGRHNDPNFYGQRGSRIIESMTSDTVAGTIQRNTIVSSECCFGAQLFSPSSAKGKLPIATAYLNAGAIGFFGSTTTAYGAATKNGGADLMAQFFLINALGGASLGRACLQARQKFIYSQKMENPVNLKTVAQFVLLGDPSLQPVRGEQDKDFADYINQGEMRRTRRVALVAAGNAAASASGFPGRKLRVRHSTLHGLVRRIAQQKGYDHGSKAIATYEIVGGERYAEAMKGRKVQQKVFVAWRQESARGRYNNGIRLTRLLVAHSQNDRLTEVSEYVRR
jgi:Peptidase family C25